MSFLRSKLCSSFTTASFCLPSSSPAFVSSTTSPRSFTLQNPDCFRSLSMFSHLKSWWTRVVDNGDYKIAVKLQVTHTATTQNDAGGKFMSNLNKSIKEDRCEDAKSVPNHVGAGLVGWWAGVSEDRKNPYGQIIHISPEDGRFLAKSYSAWQLAASKEGTPLFEIYIATSVVGEHKEQAICLNYKAAAQDGKGVDSLQDMLGMEMFHLTEQFQTMEDMLARLFKNTVAANPETAPAIKKFCSEFQVNLEPTKAATDSGNGALGGKDQAVIGIIFSLGRFKEENAKKLEKELCRVPAVLDRKGCFSFCLTVEEDKDQQFDDNTKEYCAED